MPHVAFDPTVILKSHVAAKAAAQNDAPAFESLLDTAQPPTDSSPPADNRAANSADDRPAARADRPDRAPARDRAKSKDDSKASSRTDDDKTTKASDEPSKTDAAATDAKAPVEKKAEADPKSEGKKDAKSETDAKASELVVTTATPDAPADAAAQAAVTAAVQTLTPADAVAAAIPAAVEAAADKPVADATAEGTIAAAGKGKSGKLAAAKTANGQATDEAKAGTETGKAETGDQTDKAAANPEKVEKADAHARGEAHVKETATVDIADKAAFDPAQAAPKGNVDAAQTAALAARTQQAAPAATTAATAAAAPAAQQATAAIPLSGVAFEIASKAQSSTNHFEIRLDPPELGRIEVRLDVDKDGNVTSNMIVDRPETLDLLRRDAGGLDRALQDAGLKTSNNGLQFQLRDQSGQQQQQGQSSANTTRLVVQDENFTNAAVARDYGRLAGQGSGVDIHV